MKSSVIMMMMMMTASIPTITVIVSAIYIISTLKL